MSYRKVMYTCNQPISLTGCTSVDGITAEGVQPANTDRRVAFFYQGTTTYFKLTPDPQGNATITNLPTQAITVDSLLAEGNTCADLAAIKSIPDFVGKSVCFVAALSMQNGTTDAPTLKLSIPHSSVNAVLHKEIESQVYKLLDDTVIIDDPTAQPTHGKGGAVQSHNDITIPDANILAITPSITTVGHGSAKVMVRLFANGSWGDYVLSSTIHNAKASKVQFKCVYDVTITDGTDSATVENVDIVYCPTLGAKVSGSVAEVITNTMHYARETEGKGIGFAQCLIRHKRIKDASFEAFVAFRSEPVQHTREQIGVGTGSQATYKLTGTGINHNNLFIYVDGLNFPTFDFNTKTAEVTLTAPLNKPITATYQSGWEEEKWNKMSEISSQKYDADGQKYATRYTYTCPPELQGKTITDMRFTLNRPAGHEDNVVLGKGTGDTQVFTLPHFARTDTINCTGQWSYEDKTKELKVIADKGTDIKISYQWTAETPEIYAYTAGWVELQ